MRVRQALVSSYYVPESDRDSGSRRIGHLVEFLVEAGWTVDFWATNGIGDPRYARALRQAGVAVHDGERGRLDDLMAARRFDLALFAFWPVAALQMPIVRRSSPSTRVIVDSLDLHFLRDARRILRTVADDPKGEAAFLLDEEFGSQFTAELNSYAAADAVMAVSRKEADLLNDFAGNLRLAHVIPDCEDMRVSTIPMAQRRGVLSVASYQHPPNLQAIEYLCRDVLPRVDRRLLAEHPVYVVGNGLDDNVRRLGEGLEGVRMVGWVPSVEPYFERARISVVPLLYGAGTKRKMIQALMTGTPTVSTSVGTEGLDLRDGEHVLVADDPATFAASIERLLQDTDLCQRLSQAGHEHVAALHGRAATRDRFLELVERTLAGPAKPPLLPECSREDYSRRVMYQVAQQMAPAVRELVDSVVPRRSTVAVASGGAGDLLRFREHTGWHFPQGQNGHYRDGQFADASAAVNHLDGLRAKGADYFVLPTKLTGWLLTTYPNLKSQLDNRYQLIAERDGVGLVYELNGHSARANGREASNGSVTEIRVSQPRRAEDSSATGPSGAVDTKLIAFYLPQYHPIPENDAWWGEGFTEWQNVAKALPLFPGHYQPHLPADLGFYDLRLAETRREQADLARRYGIHGFCYYHYWFGGKRLLERPFNEVLRSGEPDFPFCLCWANEPWSRRWDGGDTDILQPQSYGPEDDAAHFRWLLDALTDPRAIRIDGKPLFLVYRGQDLPDPTRTIDTWRREAERAGLRGLYLMTVETGWDAGWDATEVGFDAKVLFQPQFSMLATVPRLAVRNDRLRVYDYEQAWPVLANPEPVPYPRYDCVFPTWDNTARKGQEGWVLHNSTPAAYEQWLRLAVERAATRPADQRVVFINAWNEWAEGCHLEPDHRNGLAYLEATRRALGGAPAGRPPGQRPSGMVATSVP